MRRVLCSNLVRFQPTRALQRAFSTAGDELFIKLSSQHSSIPFGDQDFEELIKLVLTGEVAPAQEPVLLRVLCSKPFIAPHSADGEPMIYENDEAGVKSISLPLFSSETLLKTSFDDMEWKELDARGFVTVLNRLRNGQEEKGVKRVSVVFDKKLSIEWNESVEQAFIKSLESVYTRNIIQGANSPEEVEDALRGVLEAGSWYVLEHKEKDGSWTRPTIPFGPENKPAVLTMCAPDLCLRVNTRPEDEARLSKIEGKTLLNLVRDGERVLLGHDVTTDSKLGCIELDGKMAKQLETEKKTVDTKQ